MTKTYDLPKAKWDTMSRVSTPGKTRILVRCLACYTLKWGYIWSWAGHGLMPCGSGEHRLDWKER